MAQDLLVIGPFLNQVNASSVQVQSNAAGGAITTLGAMAAAVGGSARNANGFPTVGLLERLSWALNANGQAVGASASGTNFGLTFSASSGAYLASPTANNSTIAPVAAFEIQLPVSYVAGQNITLTVYQNIVIGSGTVTTKTLTAAAYLAGNDGTSGSNLIATAAQTLTNTNTALTFTITGTTLTPGAKLYITLTGALTETSAHAVTFNINQISLS